VARRRSRRKPTASVSTFVNKIFPSVGAVAGLLILMAAAAPGSVPTPFKGNQFALTDPMKQATGIGKFGAFVGNLPRAAVRSGALPLLGIAFVAKMAGVRRLGPIKF